MRIFGLEIRRAKLLTASPVDGSNAGWFGVVREAFGGAWQSNIAIENPKNILAFSAVFSCVTLIASDIAKLGMCLTVEDDGGIHSEIETASPFLPVLQKPNKYQTWYKFIEQWIVSKLLYGNTYVLKERDLRGIVTAMHILCAPRVVPLLAENGEIYYKLSPDNLSGVGKTINIPASEIIHDTMVSLWHPLVGISPIYACGMSATQGLRIQSNSTAFFANASRPSGILTAPGVVKDEDIKEMKAQWEENYKGPNAGRIAVVGGGLTYAAMTIPAGEAQLIEQLKWTVEDVARCFHVPLWKLGDKEPLRTSVESLNQTYYSDCLQAHIESIEALLDDGLSMPPNYHCEFELDALLRMDTAARYTALGTAVKDGWMAPNEARKREDMQPVDGGYSPYLQQQNYSLAALAKRDAKGDPFATASPKPPADPNNPPQAGVPLERIATLGESALEVFLKAA